MHTLLFCDPGHFHAALTLRVTNPRVDPAIHVYAPEGPDLDAFLALIDSFNSRADDPTRWEVNLHVGPDPMARLIDERRGEIAVLAGRNNGKLAAIRALHDAGLHALVDKPWITSSAALPDLEAVTEDFPLALDIMTNRHDTIAQLRRQVITTENVFGTFDIATDEPAFEIGSIHHLYKVVNGKPLQRPQWYFDSGIQGDGLVDIQSHIVDQAQWLIDPDDTADYEQDFTIDTATRWPTEVPLDLFAESTGADAFTEGLSDPIEDGVLQLSCNGQIDYRLKGVRVRQRAEWGQREPAGSGDIHSAVVRGTGCGITIRQGPETGHVNQIHLTGSADLRARVEDALPSWRETLPGLACRESDLGLELTVPNSQRTGHESHFPMVLDWFLDHVEGGRWPAGLAKRIRSRYKLLAHAREQA